MAGGRVNILEALTREELEQLVKYRKQQNLSVCNTTT